MSFRNINFVVPRETSTCKHVILIGTDFNEENLNVSLPSSCDYSLQDMIAAGVNVQVVNPTVIHDSSASSVVVDSVMSNYVDTNSVDTDSVESSNND